MWPILVQACIFGRNGLCSLTWKVNHPPCNERIGQWMKFQAKIGHANYSCHMSLTFNILQSQALVICYPMSYTLNFKYQKDGWYDSISFQEWWFVITSQRAKNPHLYSIMFDHNTHKHQGFQALHFRLLSFSPSLNHHHSSPAFFLLSIEATIATKDTQNSHYHPHKNLIRHTSIPASPP